MVVYPDGRVNPALGGFWWPDVPQCVAHLNGGQTDYLMVVAMLKIGR